MLTPSAVVAGGKADPVDLVAGALVVDERAGPELADRQEPRPLHVVALALLRVRPIGGDERRERQPRERVAGQEAFGSEVAVGVEVALVHVIDVALEQVERGAGLGDLATGPSLARFGRADLLEDGVGGVEFRERVAVQAAPSVEAAAERVRRIVDGLARSSPRATMERR